MKCRSSVAVLCASLMFSPSVESAVTHELVPSFPAGLAPGVLAWDLQVEISAGDDWTSSSMNGAASAGSFVDPNPSTTYVPPFNLADTWFAASSAPPNGGGSTGFAGPTSIGAAAISATWFDTTNAASGTFIIARILATGDAAFTLEGASTTVQGAGQLTAYSFTVNATPGCGASAGDCCSAHDTPYCNDGACCNLICDTNPFCCEVAWDSTCAEQALDLCANLCKCPGQITHEFVPTFPAGLPPGVLAWDLQVNVCARDDWTASSMNGTASAGSFVDPHPSTTYVPPFNLADTWFAAGSAPPNGGGFTSFAGLTSIEAAAISATWFDTVNMGGGTFIVARVLATEDAAFTVEGASTTAQGGGQLFPYSFAVAPKTGCGGTADHNCFTEGGPGCTDPDCCQTVCAGDPFCCEVEWDGNCVGQAIEMCDGCGDPKAGDCCTVHGSPYCNDRACCDAVCEADPFCCDIEWDSICVGGAVDLCQALCDCNDNDIADNQELSGAYANPSHELSPVGEGYFPTYRLDAPPWAADHVLLWLEGYGDFSETNEYVTVHFNGLTNKDQVGVAFRTEGHDCPDVPDVDIIIVPAAVFNEAAATGNIDITFESHDVNPFHCDPFTWISVNTQYEFTRDCNGNGTLDECDIAAGTSLDANGNGFPDECETWLCPADATFDGIVDIDDLLLTINTWGACGAPCPTDCAPPGGDGDVGVDDLLGVMYSWGPCP